MRGGYGRVLRTRRWVLRSAIALGAVAACVLLSYWQYVRTQDQIAVARAAVAQVTEYEAVLPVGSGGIPAEGLGRQVTVRGEVVAGARSFVRSRMSPDGEVGYVVVDGLRLADGRVVAVVIGWVPRPAAAPDLTGQQVTVTGRLQPDENFYPQAPVTPDDPLVTITGAGLSTQWPAVAADLAPGYVVVTEVVVPGAELVRPVIGSDPDVPYPWQNVFYTLQWLIFGGVVVVMWWRWLRDDVRDEQATDGVPTAPQDRVSL